MSAEVHKAAKIRAPNDIGRTANDFGVRKFTASTTHGANAVPDAWRGRWVRITVVGGNLHYGFSASSSAEVDSGETATAAGASDGVGDYIADGGSDQCLIPEAEGTVYFVREASASCTVYMRLADGE